MKRVFKEFKKYKYTTISIILFFILIVVAYFSYNLLFGARGIPQYGNRLDGIEEVKPSKDSFDNSIAEIKKNYNFVTDAEVYLSGRTINYVVTVSAKTSASKAKEMIKKVTSTYKKEQIQYFDFQVFVKNEDSEAKGYPIIGYKSKRASDFSYSQAS